MSRAVIFGCSGPRLTDREARFFRDADPWGLILFARNVESPAQLRNLTDDFRVALGWHAPILIDQEGGRVQRMGPPNWRGWLPPLDQMDLVASENKARALWLRYRVIAAELRAVGIDVNCAPCLDIAGPDTHPFLQNRCLGRTAEDVTKAGRAVIAGHLAGGVLPVVKHMPGHGRATQDSHEDLPEVVAARGELELTDFSPFRMLNDAPMGMTGHMRFSAISEEPTTISSDMIGVIRSTIGFDGLLLTDDISMGALAGRVAENAERAWQAGCDVVLHCNGEASEMEGIAASAPVLSRCRRHVLMRLWLAERRKMWWILKS